MPRSSEVTKERILNAAYEMLYREGFSRVTMDRIAGAAGVTKKAIYYHFESKDSLVAEMLDRQHSRALALFQGWADPAAATSAQFVQALFSKLEEWASQPRWYGSGFTRLTMELADLPGHPVRKAAHRHKKAIEIWLSGVLEGLGNDTPNETAQQIILLIEGCLSLALIHQDPAYIRSGAAAAERLLPRSQAKSRSN